MPNRYLRESYLESEAVNAVSRDAELCWTHLIVKVDDFGRCEGNLRVLRAKLFPLRLDTIREADLSRWLAECEKAGLIRRYEVAGKQYLQMEKWERGRAHASKYPQPSTDANICMQTYANVPDPDPDPDPDPEKETPKPPWQGDFARFWEVYPNKTGRKPSEEKWKKKKPNIQAVLAALAWQCASQKWKEGIIPNPLTYINEERWKDEPSTLFQRGLNPIPSVVMD